MRRAELWSRLEAVLGKGYVGSWTSTVILRELEGRAVNEALAVGAPCKKIWRTVRVALKLPEAMQ